MQITKKLIILSLLTNLLLLINLTTTYAQSNSSCNSCHSTTDLTMDRGGKDVSLFVDSISFAKSTHGSLECVNCHEGFNPDDMPHKSGKNIAKVNCTNCHDGGDFSKSIHGEKKVECYSCHTKHNVASASEIKKNEANLCKSCHNTGSVSSYFQSTHFTLQMSGKKVPTCSDCHQGSAHKVERAWFSVQQEKALCSKCHTTHSTTISGIHDSNAGMNAPGCVQCHGYHQTTVNKFSISSLACLKCHLDEGKFTEKQRPRMVGFVKKYQTSVHAIGKNNHESATCADCHQNHVEQGLDASKKSVARENIPNMCGSCHKEQLIDYKQSSHGEQFAKGKSFAPVCTDCHGEHEISGVKSKELKKIKIKEMCLKCHAENQDVIKAVKKDVNQIKHYTNSVHYKAIERGKDKAAVCSDCHGSHKMLPASNAESMVNKKNLANTCGTKECHPKEALEYNVSVHKKAIDLDKNDAPTCNDCHGDHQILNKQEFNKNSKGQAISKMCSDCHGDVEMANKNKFPLSKNASYYDSFHGLAVRGGSKFAADCSSCHMTHKIMKADDPESSINEKNLGKTCGKCHPGANIQGEFKKVHLTGSKNESDFLYWLKFIYLILIFGTIGAMTLHNILDLIHKFIERKAHKHHIEELKKSGKVYLRMTVSERIQHFIMLTTFIGLVISGFGLVYPDSFWVRGIRYVMGQNAFELRSLSHRILGIGMVLVSLYHTYYILFVPRGRRLFLDMLPKWKDAQDVVGYVKYLLWISKEKPKFERFNYMEKAEYLALVWGTAVMSVTGLFLMFNNYFLAHAPKIVLDIATLIHFFEAWLAALAILVWHFYAVIFNPEVFPVNTTFITGTISEEMMKHEHPLELERIEKAKANRKKNEDSEESGDETE